MGEKGYTRDTQQFHVKIKELCQMYQKAREANSRSGAKPHTCWLYNELHAILGGDPTSTPTSNMGTSQVCESRDNKEDDMVDEEEKEEENGRQVSDGSILPMSQEIFLTLKPQGSQDITVADHDAGEGTSAGNLSFGMPSTPESRLSLIRRRRKRMREDMFTEIMNASWTADTELRALRISQSKKLDMDMESRKASNEQERAAQDEMLWIMRDQADMLRHLVKLQEQKQEGRVPLQMQVDSQPASPGAESPSSKRSLRCG
ncbi:junctional adhesion molecule B isoform X4 [Emys orbicularis]|uniref:junctional adhesion molecule B isoform X4 n=1 Tax=Emys orbicularis TaxID=82168 RepID=UPI0031FD7151